ncbi:(d)CMP kinase [Salinifilum aidingensis]
MAQLRGVVALDGPSGTGKSTVARRLATELGAKYLDTGAMYRAATLAVLRAEVDPADAVEVERVVRTALLSVRTEPDRPAVLLDGAEVEAEIRGAEVTGAVSAVSAIPAVREVLVEQQRAEVRGALDGPGGIVVEGRDIGTAVVPDARLKVFLTASTDARAQRRTAQDAAAGRSGDVPSTAEQVRRRDQRDAGRSASPMRQATDAVELDTTELGVAEVLTRLHELVEARGLLGDCAPSASERTAG